MTKGMLWFLLLNNACVLCLCTYYFFQGDVIYWVEDSAIPRLRMNADLSSRAIGLIPFVFSFAYLLYMLRNTVAEKVVVNALDAPITEPLSDRDDQ